jgi:hypothetical protein
MATRHDNGPQAKGVPETPESFAMPPVFEAGADGEEIEDLRAVTPLIYGHVNPYGIFRLDMNARIPIDTWKAMKAVAA